jgi:hypothetical protein
MRGLMLAPLPFASGTVGAQPAILAGLDPDAIEQG